MKAIDLKTKDTNELQQELHALLKEWFNLRMQKATGQKTLPHLFNKVKRQIARVKTILSEKEGHVV
jgi:large subunit ribosomal protein L29